jgi:signal transduction histidine kinase
MSERDEAHGTTILIVDDDDFTREMMRAELEAAGFTVFEAADGVAACELCLAAPPALIIADVVMPRMDGFMLSRELRHNPKSQFVPILVATGLDDVDSIEKAYEAGATDFICKPINWRILKHRVRYILRTARALQQLREHQGALLAAKNAAESASRAKSEFLANMSHELRTPLNAIIGFSTIMHDSMFGPLPERYEQYPGMICDSGTHLLSIINDILDLAKAESNTLQLREEEVDLAQIIAKASAIVEGMADKAGVRFHVTASKYMPKLRADPVRLQQILLNLLVNAVKFTQQGGEVSLFAELEPSGDWLLRVVDTGIGIPKEKLGVAMAPFGQVDNGLARKYDGTGLGLPLTKRLVEMQGGAFDLVSEPGWGTAVTVRFPSTLRVADKPVREAAAKIGVK